MKISYIPLIVLCIYGCGKIDKSSSLIEPENLISIGKIDSINSTILGESRKIWIHLPLNLEEGTKYPVLYLLDDPSHFYSVTGLINQFSTSNGNTILPEMIVVAIPNTNGSRDLTPTKVDLDFSPAIVFSTRMGAEISSLILLKRN